MAILKVSNASEDPEVLDMEAEAALQVTAADPGLRVALPWRPAQSGATAAVRRPGPPGAAGGRRDGPAGSLVPRRRGALGPAL